MKGKRHKYVLLDANVDWDGWWKWNLQRDDGRIVKASKSRLREMRRNGQVVERFAEK